MSIPAGVLPDFFFQLVDSALYANGQMVGAAFGRKLVCFLTQSGQFIILSLGAVGFCIERLPLLRVSPT